MDIKKLMSLTRRDPLAFGITFVDLLDGKKWEVDTRTWIKEIYASVNPWEIEKNPIGLARHMSIMKSTQCGMSTMAMTKMLHFALNWPSRTMYTLPRQMDVLDFTTTRLDPMIKASPYFSDKLGAPDSAHAKQLGDSYLYIMEMSVEPRMLPGDALFIDEVDLSDPINMSTVLNRLDASKWKLNYFFSTPTLPNYGIHNRFLNSDRREWMVKCPKCNHQQVLDWDENLRLIGPHQNPTEVYFGCVKCNHALTLPVIQQGQWVAEIPDLSDDHIGFHVSQLMTHTAAELYKAYRDPQTLLVEFYRKRLGKPYEIGGGSIDRDDLLVTCFDEPYEPELGWDGISSYYMGVDQGNELQVLIAKILPDTNRPKIVHIELVPMEEGFDRVAQLIDLFHIKRTIIDGNPNRHEAVKLVNRFPSRVLVADYIEQKNIFTSKKGLGKNFLTNVTLNRTASFDSLIDSIKKSGWALPGTPPKLSPEVEILIDQSTAIKRDTEKRRTPSGEIEVGVWRSVRPDHLAHSWVYLHTAVQVDRGRRTRIAIIGKKKEEEEEQVDENMPENEVIEGIRPHLAEISVEQLEDYVATPKHIEDLPFPLSHKMNFVVQYDEEDILWVMYDLIKDKHGL